MERAEPTSRYNIESSFNMLANVEGSNHKGCQKLGTSRSIVGLAMHI
jgi:hypothetical protein